MANYDVSWDETTPPGSAAMSTVDDRVRELKAQLRQRLATEHATLTDETGDKELIHLAGQCTVLYVGTTAQIAALTNSFATANLACIAFDTTLGALKYFNGTSWTVLPFDWDSMFGAGDPVHTHASDAEGGAITGTVAQIVTTQTGAVATGATVTPLDDTIPQKAEGDQYLSRTITPESITNELYIDVNVMIASNASGYSTVALFHEDSDNALAAKVVTQVATGVNEVSFKHKMTAGEVTEKTFTVRIGTNAGSGATLTLNGREGLRLYGGAAVSSITITEITI